MTKTGLGLQIITYQIVSGGKSAWQLVELRRYLSTKFCTLAFARFGNYDEVSCSDTAILIRPSVHAEAISVVVCLSRSRIQTINFVQRLTGVISEIAMNCTAMLYRLFPQTWSTKPSRYAYMKILILCESCQTSNYLKVTDLKHLNFIPHNWVYNLF